MLKNPAANAGDTGSIPGRRSHMVWGNYAREPQPLSHVLQLRKPVSREPVLQSKRSNCKKKALRNWRAAPAPTRESPPAAKDPAQPQHTTTQMIQNKQREVCQSLSRVRFFASPRTVGGQAPLSTEFSRQESWSGLPCPFPRDLPDPGLLHCKQILYHLSHQGSHKQTNKKLRFWS